MVIVYPHFYLPLLTEAMNVWRTRLSPPFCLHEHLTAVKRLLVRGVRLNGEESRLTVCSHQQQRVVLMLLTEDAKAAVSSLMEETPLTDLSSCF